MLKEIQTEYHSPYKTRQKILHLCISVFLSLGPFAVFGVCLGNTRGCRCPCTVGVDSLCRFTEDVALMRPSEGNARVLELESISSLVESVLLLV